MVDDPFNSFSDAEFEAVLAWARRRIEVGSDPETGARSANDLEAALADSITPDGIGATEALRRFIKEIVPATRAQDDPMNLAYIPSAPSPASVAFDLAVSAAGIFGGYWETGAGAIHAENQALGWLCGLAGWPPTAGGVFVPGGTLGNVSALHAAREWALRQRGSRPERWRLAASATAHSSVVAAARLLDIDILEIEPDEHERLTGDALAAGLELQEDVFAVLATAGTTNEGAIDDLRGIAKVCVDRELWLHVDGAYGLGALASPQARLKFDGIEKADSFIVDPHKWLFAPYDCCALLYRYPERAMAAHGQHAGYLETIARDEWNPSDFAVHLSRRARGLPLWFSLATYGADRYALAIDQVLETTSIIADGIRTAPHLELLLEPELSVILFRRSGWPESRMLAWSQQHRRLGTILCLPTRYRGELVFRLALVNPKTVAEKVLTMLNTMK